MATTRAVALAVLIVLCGATVTPVAVALEGGFAGLGDGSTDEPDTERPMGAEVSAFMQSTAADSSASVDQRLFAGAYERADGDARAAVVDERVDRLEERLAALEAERDELREREGELNPVAYDARMSRLAVQIDGLERAIDDVEARGADGERLEALRDRAANASGPEVAAAAQGLAGVDPPRGPPGDDDERGGGPPADDERDGGPPDDDDRGGGPPDDDDRGGGPPGDDDERGGGPPDDDDERGGGPPADDERGDDERTG